MASFLNPRFLSAKLRKKSGSNYRGKTHHHLSFHIVLALEDHTLQLLRGKWV